MQEVNGQVCVLPAVLRPKLGRIFIFGKRRNYMPDNKATPHSEIKKAIEPAKAPEPKTAPATEVKKTAEPDKVPEPTAVPAAEVKKPAETAKAPEPKMLLPPR